MEKSSLSKRQILIITLPLSIYLLVLVTTNLTVFTCSYQLGVLDQFTIKNALIMGTANITAVLLFCTVMMLVATGCFLLQSTNLLLQRVIENPEGQEKLKILKIVSSVHEKICESFESISKFFLLFIIDLLTAYVIFVVFVNFSFFIYIKNPQNNILTFVVSGSSWVTLYAPCVVWLLIFVNWTRKECKRSACLASQLVDSETSLKDVKRISCLLLQMEHRTPKISCGLFELDWHFYFFTLGTIFSMTIIFIQFYDVPSN
jgi:7tm Chemosensory receptor